MRISKRCKPHSSYRLQQIVVLRHDLQRERLGRLLDGGDDLRVRQARHRQAVHGEQPVALLQAGQEGRRVRVDLLHEHGVHGLGKVGHPGGGR